MFDSPTIGLFDESRIVPDDQELISKLTEVRLEGIDGFSVKDRLPRLNIRLLGKKFNKNFLYRTEEEILSDDISVYQLEKDSTDGPIFGQLEERPEVRLAHVFELIRRQSIGQKGVLATNGFSNVAYVRYDSILWTIQFRWLPKPYKHWRVEAHYFNRGHGWRKGCRIISRNSDI